MGGRGGISGFGNSENKIISFERANYKSALEHGLLIQADGTIKKYDGSEHHLEGTAEEIKRMSGGIFTHNHPTNVTFSNDDIVNGIVKGNLKEMRAITSTGEVHVLRNNGATLEERRKFFAGFQQAQMKATNFAHAKARRGEAINTQQYVSGRVEKYMEENAAKYHLTFKKKRKGR